jgi:RNA polymerase sigma-70 factor (ECF subfamily)
MEMRKTGPSGRAGSPGEFEAVVKTYQGQVMALALNILGNRSDAEDVSQESFIQAFRHRDDYDPARSFKSWLFTIVHRRCLDVLKRRRRFFRAFDRIKREIPAPAHADAANPGGRCSLPGAFLVPLSPKERTALCLWANEDFTPREIAEVLACSEQTARVHLFSARKKIKSLLETQNVSLPRG